MSVTDEAPLAGRLLEIVGRLSNRMTQQKRAKLAQEGSDIVGQLAGIETGYGILVSTLKQQQEATRRAEARETGYRRRAEILEQELNESIAHVDASVARMRQSRARVSGQLYDSPQHG